MELIDREKKKRMEAYIQAQKRVDELKGFYSHLVVYLLVNAFVSYKKIERNLESGETFQEALFDFSTFVLWLAWGIGLAIHAYNVFF